MAEEKAPTADEAAPVTGEETTEDAHHGEEVLREKVDEYKRTHPEVLPEFDYALLVKSMKRVNEDSPVKIARNAVNEMREWIPGSETWNVGRVYLSDDHYVTFTVSHGDKAMTVSDLFDELEEIDKKLPLKDVPIMIQLNETTRIRATDLYAHSLVSSMWAGLPVDFVLCYTQKTTKKHEPEAEQQHSESN